MNSIYVELNENVDRIVVSFPYSKDDVARIKGEYIDEKGGRLPGIKGRHWDRDNKVWIVPMDLSTAKLLREIYGDRMELGPAMKAWARQQVNLERNLRSLHSATDANLNNIPRVIEDVISGKAMKQFGLPSDHILMKKRDARPYQRADVKLMALASAMNLNDVGVGKTLEACAAVYEADLFPQPVLVVAPRRSLVTVWKTEFERLTDYTVLTSENPRERGGEVKHFLNMIKKNRGEPYVLALIADDIRLTKYRDVKNAAPDEEHELHACRDYKGNWYKFRSEVQRDLFKVQYGAFIIDEFHGIGLPNRKSLFHVSAKLIKSHRRWPMSGTPIGGKPRRLWPCLNFIDPKGYTSEWRWIDEFLEIEEEEIYVKGGSKRTVRNVGDIKDEKMFYEAHKKHMVRRTKLEALPGLPPMLDILVETPMTETQKAMYDKFDEEHEIVIDEKRLSGSIVLAQYVRLRQLANAALKSGKKGGWLATQDSGKLEHLLERLDENGIRKYDPEPGARAYIGVVDKSFVTAIIDFLRANKIECGRLDGDTKDSKPIIDHFNDPGRHPEPYVIVMTNKTGGSAINLGSAGSAHLAEEEWDPDISHQFFGRGDRGGRTTSLKCYTYRTPNSIQEYVAKVAGGKRITNSNVLNFAKEIEKLRRA
jgi:SNF2 family DNA or RNA helicase